MRLRRSDLGAPGLSRRRRGRGGCGSAPTPTGTSRLFRSAVTRDLRSRGPTRQRALAAALRVVDLGVIRTGGEEYAVANGSYGIATMLREHVRMSGRALTFRFPAKSGVLQLTTVEDEDLCRAVRAMRRGPGERLLRYRSDGGWHDVRAADVNDRFRDLVGEDYTVKDLRTWYATVSAAAAFARGLSEPDVMKVVAEDLGNTPAVARDSYVDPRVTGAAGLGRVIPAGLPRPAAETATRRLLEDADDG